MELANHLVEKGRVLAGQYLAGKIELPAQIDTRLGMWLALPDDKTILAFGVIAVLQNQVCVEFKVGTKLV